MVDDDTSLNTIPDDDTEYTASASSTNLGGALLPVVCIQCSDNDDSTQTTIDSSGNSSVCPGQIQGHIPINHPTDIETETCPNRIVDIKNTNYFCKQKSCTM